MKLQQLHPNTGQIKGVPANPRQITEAEFRKLKRSLQEFPHMLEARPIIIDEDFNILGGNMRYQALCKLADEHAQLGTFTFSDNIPDNWIKQVTTWDSDKKAEFIIKDNNEFGEYDWDMIANEWGGYALDDWGVNLPAWEAPEDTEPTDLERERRDKPFTIKLTFESQAQLEEFTKVIGKLQEQYRFEYSISAGEL